MLGQKSLASADASACADSRLRVARRACEESLQSSVDALMSSHRCHPLP